MDWLSKHKLLEWAFGGVGVAFIGLVGNLIRIFLKRHKYNKTVQKSGNNSKNYLAGRDMHIGDKSD